MAPVRLSIRHCRRKFHEALEVTPKDLRKQSVLYLIMNQIRAISREEGKLSGLSSDEPDCPASAGGKTTDGCFLCVPETEFRQGIQKRQNKGSICLCPEPGTVSACVSKANQLKPYEYFSMYLGSTVYIQKTTNKKPTKKALPN